MKITGITEQENLMKTLAMEESLKKSRAMIFYTSDRVRLPPPKGRYRIIEVTKSFVPQYKPITRMRKHNADC